MAIGDVVATITAPNLSGTYSLSSNPSGFFAVKGNTIVQAVNASFGLYPITLQFTGPGVLITQSFILQFGVFVTGAYGQYVTGASGKFIMKSS